MERPQTVIDKAIELVTEHGKEYAIEFFKREIDDIGEINGDFTKLCNVSGLKTANSLY
jgi:hypothetical protein